MIINVARQTRPNVSATLTQPTQNSLGSPLPICSFSPAFAWRRRNRYQRRHAFTLIELLIVVAIIAILAAIALPNFLEAQTRSKVARVKSDLRALATAIEAYRVDHNEYPEGTDNPANFDPQIVAYLGPLAAGYYTFRTQGPGGLTVGRDFANITTPIAYIASMLYEVFFKGGRSLTYCYRNAKVTKNFWILTSCGPDSDLLAPNGKGNSNTANPLSTAASVTIPARLADIDERMVIRFIEGDLVPPATSADVPRFREFLTDLTYDPTNGTISDGDIWRVMGQN
ncbi:MAG: prepilin-type N-terminal cleavage/methylation domain-containing protein [Candidatus Sumerlaeaceae bacterium]